MMAARIDRDCSAEPGGAAAARWAADGHRHLMLVLSALATDAEVASVAPWLQSDSEQLLAGLEEAQQFARRALAAARERQWLQREVGQLRTELDQLTQERERLADELTAAVNVALVRQRRLHAASRRSPAALA